jgi:hypothetical protein
VSCGAYQETAAIGSETVAILAGSNPLLGVGENQPGRLGAVEVAQGPAAHPRQHLGHDLLDLDLGVTEGDAALPDKAFR